MRCLLRRGHADSTEKRTIHLSPLVRSKTSAAALDCELSDAQETLRKAVNIARERYHIAKKFHEINEKNGRAKENIEIAWKHYQDLDKALNIVRSSRMQVCQDGLMEYNGRNHAQKTRPKSDGSNYEVHD